MLRQQRCDERMMPVQTPGTIYMKIQEATSHERVLYYIA